MKVNDKTFLSLILFCVLAALAAFLIVPSIGRIRLVDLHLRHNEISCSHGGVNPHDVFMRRVKSPIYTGYEIPHLGYKFETGKEVVHSYPPWHTTYFWFYGWLSLSDTMTFSILLNCLSLGCVLFYLRRYGPKDSGDRFLFWGICLMGLLGAAFDCIIIGNYGCFLGALSILLYEALKKRRHVLAGLAWAVIMIKPQIGILLFWPLLWGKRYVTIIVAVGVCVLATLWPAYVYHQSPITLILQIPEIGQARSHLGTLSGWAFLLLGPVGPFLWTGGCFFVCGFLSFLLRNSSSWLIRVAPALFMTPFWSYFQLHDEVMAWPLYVLIAFYLIDARKKDVRLRVFLIFLFVLVFTRLQTYLYFSACFVGWNIPLFVSGIYFLGYLIYNISMGGLLFHMFGGLKKCDLNQQWQKSEIMMLERGNESISNHAG